MKKLIALVATALIVIAASQLVTTVGATGKATIARRVAALERKVRTLQARSACLKQVIPMTQYGNPTAGQGYYYTNDGGTTVFLTTGVDVTQSGQAPGAYIAVVESRCVTGSKPAFRPAKIGHRATRPALHAK
jgi:hypothetical protein